MTEAWRIIIYSDHGKAYINLRSEKYPNGLDDLPQNFWESLSFLFSALQNSDKQELANKLMSLVEEEGLSIVALMRELKDSPALVKFIEEIGNAVMSSNGVNGRIGGGAGSLSELSSIADPGNSELSGSSPFILQKDNLFQGKQTGGIDFCTLAMAIQPMGNFSGLNFKLPQLSQIELKQIDISSELQQIKNMVQFGIIPSGQRIKELVAACIQKKEMNSQANSLLLCLVDIFKLEEENASESSPELREALVIVDSQG